MTGWEEAYEKQMEVGKFWASPIGRQYGQSFHADVALKGRPGAENYEVIAAIEYGKMLQANPIFVDEDMFDLWEHATKSFQPEPLMPSDLVTLGGFVYLPKPQYMFDIENKVMSYRAISWMPTVFTGAKERGLEPGMHFDPETVMSRTNAPAIIEERVKNSGADAPGLRDKDRYGLHVSLYTSIHDDDDFNPQLREMIKEYPEHPLARQDLGMCHAQPWIFGDSFEEVVPGHGDFLDQFGLTGQQADATLLGAFDFWRKLQSLFRLMNQKITTHSEYRPPRETRRRAKRMNFDDEKNVTVIQLRRPSRKNDNPEHAKVDWSHRWIVDAHWRNQWYASLKEHRQVWITPYVKGPEDKELRIKKKAYELVR